MKKSNSKSVPGLTSDEEEFLIGLIDQGRTSSGGLRTTS